MICRFCQQWNPKDARRCCFCQNELGSEVDKTVEGQISAAQRGLAGPAGPALSAPVQEDAGLSVFGRQLRLADIIWQVVIGAVIVLIAFLRFCVLS